jgi:hypothetical protein
MVKIGDHVLFFDPYGKEHHALVTCVHAQNEKLMDAEWVAENCPGMDEPMTEKAFIASVSLNLVFVVKEDEKVDPYGHQIQRYSSVVHGDRQTAHGMYWTEVA